MAQHWLQIGYVYVNHMVLDWTVLLAKNLRGVSSGIAMVTLRTKPHLKENIREDGGVSQIAGQIRVVPTLPWKRRPMICRMKLLISSKKDILLRNISIRTMNGMSRTGIELLI